MSKQNSKEQNNFIVEQINSLLIEKNVFGKDLTDYLNLPQSTLTDWRNGKTKSYTKCLQNIADFFEVPITYFYESAITIDAYPRNKTVRVPILGYAKGGQGGNWEQDIQGYELVELDDIYRDDPLQYFWLKVNGDSMSPDINDGDLVLVRKQSSVESGQLAVVGIDNSEAVVKKVKYKDHEPWLELISFNPYYPPRRFEGDEELSRVQIIGLIKESKRKW